MCDPAWSDRRAIRPQQASDDGRDLFKRSAPLSAPLSIDNYPPNVASLIADDEGPIRATPLPRAVMHWHNASLLATIADDRARRFPRGQQPDITHEIGAARPNRCEIVALDDDLILMRLG